MNNRKMMKKLSNSTRITKNSDLPPPASLHHRQIKSVEIIYCKIRTNNLPPRKISNYKTISNSWSATSKLKTTPTSPKKKSNSQTSKNFKDYAHAYCPHHVRISDRWPRLQGRWPKMWFRLFQAFCWSRMRGSFVAKTSFLRFLQKNMGSNTADSWNRFLRPETHDPIRTFRRKFDKFEFCENLIPF